MLFIQQALVFTTLLSSTFAAPHHHDDSIVDWNRLNAIVDSIDSNVLHNVLHSLTPKFRDGVFSRDRAAIEHVHSENPILASKIVYIAKRQDNSTTTDSTPSGTESVADTPSSTTEDSTDPTSSSSAADVANTPASTTSVAPVAETVSDAVAAQITATSTPDPTTITLAPTTESGEVAIATVDGGVVFSTTGGGVVTRTSSAVGVSFTRSTSTHLYYSTMPDGRVVTSTSLVVVNAPVTETAVPTGAAGAAATSGEAGLQNVAGRSTSNNVFAGLFLGVAGLLLNL